MTKMRTRNSVYEVNDIVSETQTKLNSFIHSSAFHETGNNRTQGMLCMVLQKFLTLSLLKLIYM